MSEAVGCGESSEVSWQLGSTTMYGTLVEPPGGGPFPAVVMVAGSGPTDRDWNSPLLPGSNGSARLIAEALAGAGIASLRYDKRASGPHVRENLPALVGKISMASHVEELAGAVRLLAEQPFVRGDRIFGLGNSEGTLHVMSYEIADPAIRLAGLVLVAPPGRTVGSVARSQLAEQAAALTNGDELLSLYDASVERFLAGEPANPDPLLPEGVQILVKSLETPANLPFARELWIADGAALLAQVDVPVLVIIGEKDIQVDWHADGEPLKRAAAGREQVTFLFPDNANHVLKYEPIPRTELNAADVQRRYNSDDARLDRDSSSAIVAWLSSRS